MKIHVVVLSLFLMLPFGCSYETIQNEQDIQEKVMMEELIMASLTPYQFGEEELVPTKSTNANAVEKTIKFFEVSGTMRPDLSQNCSGGAVGVLIEGEGNASHIGHYTVVNTYCALAGVPTTPISGLITAANGDEIHTVVIGSDADPTNYPILSVYYMYEIYDGTGRFEGASGIIEMEGTINVADGSWTLTGIGTIIY